jgi:ribose 5-phosphate isomerase B
MKLAFGCDHAAAVCRDGIVSYLRARGHEIIDFGCTGTESCDYPDKARAVGEAVVEGRAERGILICGTGIGMAIAANKIPAVRAAVCWNRETAVLAAEHNSANILCLGARFATADEIAARITAWLQTPFSTEERHQRRVRKITELEQQGPGGRQP